MTGTLKFATAGTGRTTPTVTLPRARSSALPGERSVSVALADVLTKRGGLETANGPAPKFGVARAASATPIDAVT